MTSNKGLPSDKYLEVTGREAAARKLCELRGLAADMEDMSSSIVGRKNWHSMAKLLIEQEQINNILAMPRPKTAISRRVEDDGSPTKTLIAYGGCVITMEYNHEQDDVMSLPQILEHLVIPTLLAHGYTEGLIEKFINVNEITHAVFGGKG